MKLEVYNIKGESTGRKVNLPDEVFGIEPHEHSVWLDVKRYLAAQRQGTHKAKERSEIQGSTRKGCTARKALVALVRAISRARCSGVVAAFLARVRAIMRYR